MVGTRDSEAGPTLGQLRALHDLHVESESDANLSGISRADRARRWQQVRRLEMVVNGLDPNEPIGDHATEPGWVRLTSSNQGRLTSAGLRLLEAAGPAIQAIETVRGVISDLGTSPFEVSVACYPAHLPRIARRANQLDVGRGRKVDLRVVAVEDDLRRDNGEALVRLVRGGTRIYRWFHTMR